MKDRQNARPKNSDEKKQIRVAVAVGTAVVLSTALLIFAIRPRTPSIPPLPSTSSFVTTSTAAVGISGITGATDPQTAPSTTLAP